MIHYHVPIMIRDYHHHMAKFTGIISKTARDPSLWKRWTLQGAWLGSGHGTVADMLKSKSTINTPLSATLMPSNTTMEYQSVQTMYLGSSDVPNSSFNLPTRSSAWVVWAAKVCLWRQLLLIVVNGIAWNVSTE